MSDIETKCLRVACPTCFAQPDEPCQGFLRFNKAVTPHLVRQQKYLSYVQHPSNAGKKE